MLLLGDCLEVLPMLGAVDAVVTDPPYGIALNTDNNRFSGGHNPSHRGRFGGTGKGAPIANDHKPFDPSFLTAYGKEQIIWGWHCFPDKLPAGSCLIWIKRLDAAFGSFLSDAETAWHSRGHGVYCFRDLSNNAVTKTRAHPTQKPLRLMQWCVAKTRGQTVCDPYMGSGSTALACIAEGRRFIGVELDPQHFDTACRRIEAAYAQPRLFAEPAPKTEQEPLL